MTHLIDQARRSFLTFATVSAGSVAFNLTLSPWVKAALKEESFEITSWLVIDPDNRVKVRIPQSEIGQGITTALTQVIADEVNLEFQLTDWEFYDPLVNYHKNNVYVHTSTLGSIGMKMLYQPMRTAGAQVRTMLMTAAAERWNIDARKLLLEDHQVVNPSSSTAIGNRL